MTNRTINAQDTYASPFYSQAVETQAGARLLTVSGQVGARADGTVADGFEAQTRQVFDNILAQLAAADMTLADVVKYTIILPDQANVAAFRQIRNEIMGDHRPASTLIVAGLAEPHWLVEVEVFAAKA